MFLKQWHDIMRVILILLMALCMAYTGSLYFVSGIREVFPVFLLTCLIFFYVVVFAVVHKRYIRKTDRRNKKGKTEEETIEGKEAMVAAVAHEIKNPLNSIKGANQYLNEKYGNNEDIKEFTQIVIDEISRLEKHLNEFMSFSRGVKLRLKKQDVHSFVTGVVMLVKHDFENTINIKVQSSGIPEVYMDQEQMRQVLVNLLNNAKEAYDGDGKPEAEVIISSDSSHVILEVKDNGRGLDEKELDRIFNPFYTTKKEGLGIGLSISRTIMRRHGGEIYAGSTKDKGSSFILKLPVEKRDDKA